VARYERAQIEWALDAAGGNRSQAARRLGISRRWLHKKLERYGLRSDRADAPS
jgi:two-component system response regulator HydG